jgi:hypothetical protein
MANSAVLKARVDHFVKRLTPVQLIELGNALCADGGYRVWRKDYLRDLCDDIVNDDSDDIDDIGAGEGGGLTEPVFQSDKDDPDLDEDETTAQINDGANVWGEPTRNLRVLVEQLKGRDMEKYQRRFNKVFGVADATPIQKDKQTMTAYDPDLKTTIIKQYGIVRFCKSVEAGDVRCSEHELTKLISEHAERNGTSFVKLFTAQTEDGKALRSAIQAVKYSQFAKAGARLKPATLKPNVTAPGWEENDASVVDDPKAALAAIQRLVDELRSAEPTLDEAHAWARVSVISTPRCASARVTASTVPACPPTGREPKLSIRLIVEASILAIAASSAAFRPASA